MLKVKSLPNNDVTKNNRYLTHIKKIKTAIKNKQFDIIYEYDYYDVTIFQHFEQLKFYFLFKDEKIMTYIINHMYYGSRTKTNWRPIHYLCKYSTPELIKLLLTKNISLECKTNNHFRPIHLACQYSTPEIVLILINKYVSLKCKTKYGYRPIHIAAQYMNDETINALINSTEAQVEDDEDSEGLEWKTNKGYTFRHFLRYNKNLNRYKYESGDIKEKVNIKKANNKNKYTQKSPKTTNKSTQTSHQNYSKFKYYIIIILLLIHMSPIYLNFYNYL